MVTCKRKFIYIICIWQWKRILQPWNEALLFSKWNKDCTPIAKNTNDTRPSWKCQQNVEKNTRAKMSKCKTSYTNGVNKLLKYSTQQSHTWFQDTQRNTFWHNPDDQTLEDHHVAVPEEQEPMAVLLDSSSSTSQTVDDRQQKCQKTSHHQASYNAYIINRISKVKQNFKKDDTVSIRTDWVDKTNSLHPNMPFAKIIQIIIQQQLWPGLGWEMAAWRRWR